MIPFLRKASNSIIMRILLAIVLIAVALSLGISNFFIRNHAQRSVAQVGASYVSLSELAEDLNAKKAALKQYFGRLITNEEAKGLGLVERSLSELITRELITQEADRIGIVASDEQLSKQIAENKEFKDASGKFNSKAFNDYLGRRKISERKYSDELRHQLNRGMLANVLSLQTQRVPKLISQPLFRYLNEERDIEIISIKVNQLPDVAKPDTATLKDFYGTNTKLFQVPETRTFTTLQFNFQELSQSIPVTAEDLQQLYKQTDNKVPEKRSIRYIPFSNREDAVKAKSELTSGAPFEAVYSRYTHDDPQNAPKAEELQLKQLPPEIGSEIFSLKHVYDVTDPILMGNYYMVFIVTDIKPEHTLTFEQQKFALLKRYKTDLTREKMYDYIQRAEKMLASGTKLNDLADALKKEGMLGVSIITFDKVTQNGLTIDGAPAHGVQNIDRKVFDTAFETPQYTYSDPLKLESEDYVIVEVTDIKAAHQRSFEDAIPQVERYWQFDQKRKKAVEEIKAIKDGLDQFQDAAKVAAAHHAHVDVLHKVTRAQPPKDPEFSGVLMQLHAAKPSEIVIDAAADRIQLGRVIGTYPVDMKTFDATAPAFTQKVMAPHLGKDLLASYIAALEAYFPVSRNDEAISTLIENENTHHGSLPQAPDF